MNNFLNDNKQVFYAVAVVGLFSLVFVFADKVPTFDRNNQLAQIIAIETELLKDWQQSRGLNNTLAYSSEGSSVVLLQRMLSQDTGIYPEKKVTGYYGDITREAVLRFQKEYNLPQSGTVDVATKDKLNEIFLSHLCPEQTVIYPEFLLRRVDRQSPMPKDYAPPSLEDISDKIKTIGTACVRKDMVPHLTKMFRDAQNDGIYLAVSSGYRKPEIQKFLYDFWLRIQGISALDEVAEPGFSEHQLGTTVDLTDASIGYALVDNSFAKSEGGKWLIQNAYKYGFTMSYPSNKERITGYKFEPWHWRYVGIDTATLLYNQQLTFSEIPQNTKKPFPKNGIATGLNVSAAAAFSVFIDANGQEHTLIEKNKERRLPIASLTKLMVVLVASDIYKTDDLIAISESSLIGKGISGYYTAGDSFLFRDALHALLLGSHNEIANALAERIGTDTFVRRMNEKASVLNLRDTHFVNVTGLDPEKGSEAINYSTASDVSKLLKYIFENRADIFSILKKNEYQLNDARGFPKTRIQNTNKLITNSDTALRVLGGKTGDTPKAKSNLAVVSDSPTRGRILSVVIGSSDQFIDMQELLKYIRDSFVW